MPPSRPAIVTRFAPSPTGLLHLGHALAALFAHDAARRAGGRFLLRVEDIDDTRCRPEYHAAIEEDLAWLGLTWDGPVRRQSEHKAFYGAALQRLQRQDLLYPCFCSRGDIARAAAAPQGPCGPVYPGLCRTLPADEAAQRQAQGRPFVWRLKMDTALQTTGPLSWFDRAAGEQPATPDLFGDVVLGRRDNAVSYHLAVTLDDAAQGVTLVTRGEDLFAASHVHRLLQALLDLPVPQWHHHRLVTDAAGKRLAKRDGATSLRTLRSGGMTPAEIRNRLGR